MAKTRYDKENALHSQKAHKAARELIYPRIFPESELSFCECDMKEEGTFHFELDKKMGIDKIVRVKPAVTIYRDYIGLSFQERFRSMKDYHYREVTITEWNEASDRPSELYKLYAHYFMYGYYDPEAKYFAEVIVLNVAALQDYLMGQKFVIRGRNTKQQPFVCLPIDELLQHDHLVRYYERNDDPKWFDESDPFEEEFTGELDLFEESKSQTDMRMFRE